MRFTGKTKIKQHDFKFRYIDDVLSLNNSKLGDYVVNI